MLRVTEIGLNKGIKLLKCLVRVVEFTKVNEQQILIYTSILNFLAHFIPILRFEIEITMPMASYSTPIHHTKKTLKE